MYLKRATAHENRKFRSLKLDRDVIRMYFVKWKKESYYFSTIYRMETPVEELMLPLTGLQNRQ